MTSLVLDCSITVAWCFEDEASESCDELLDVVKNEGAVVPSLWHLELGNVLIQAERRGRITSVQVTTLLELFAVLPIETDRETPMRALNEILGLARVLNLTTYDAAYLELAIRKGLPLASKDKRLRNAAIHSGIVVLPV